MTNTAADMQPSKPSSSRHVVRHTKCSDWGRGLLMWERDGKRGYQFEDGQLRIFAEGFFHLLKDVPQADAQLKDTLEGLASSTTNSSRSNAAREKRIESHLAVEDQLQHFQVLYPGGFSGELWQTKQRGKDQARALKRHRDPIIAEAAVFLSAAQESVARDECGDVGVRLVELLGKTDLVPKKKLSELKELRFEKNLVTSLIELLEADRFDALRFDQARRALGIAGMQDPGWSLLTGLLTIVRPQVHVHVRPSAFDVQARVLNLEAKSASRPTATAYEAYLGVAQTLRARLEALGAPPADMLDTYDFMWATLRPAERDALDALATERLKQKTEASAPA